MPENLFFAPHTRWDREWYKSFEVFRLNFVNIMDDFLEFLRAGGSFPGFFLDGQVILLMDYLYAYPEKREYVADLVKKGILRLGPWMIQPDLFMTDGEMTVRNLLHGHRESMKWKDWVSSLYIPESTGIISQLPQIMKNFGMEHLVFIRGLGNEPVSSEYRLIGADGTPVVATYLVYAYNNAGFLPENLDEAKERIREEITKLAPESKGGWILLNQGGDHQAPQTFLGSLIDYLRQDPECLNVEAGAYDDYFKHISEHDLSDLPVLRGEYRDSRHYPILAGKISSRMDMKLVTNNHINEMLYFAEPLAVTEWLLGRPYPDMTFDRIWQLLLENQHHTTAGGTVVDQVYEEAMVRLEKVADLLDEEWRRSIRFLAGRGIERKTRPESPVMVLNSLPQRRSGLVVVNYTTTNAEHNIIKVFNEQGGEVPFQVLNSAKREGMFPYYSRSTLRQWELAFQAQDVPALGYKLYTIKTETGEEEVRAITPASTIRNEFLEVGFEYDGTFFIKDLQTGREYRNMHRFIDEADAGDLYNFSPIPGDMTLAHIVQDITMELPTSGELQQTLRLKGNFSIPSGLSKDRTRRSNDRVLCPFTLNISLLAGLPYVDCHLMLENKAKDHRLRVTFPTDSHQGVIRVGQPFDFVERHVDPPTGEDWIEAPSRSQPFQGFLDMEGEEGSLAIFSQGPVEYEVVPSGVGNEIRLTLLRAVNWMSREGLITRKVEAGPKVATPMGQVQETLSYRYAIIPHKNDEDIPGLAALYQLYRNPIKSITLPSFREFPESKDLITLAPACLVVSACKRSLKGDSIILRFYNPTDEPVPASVTAAETVKGCRKTTMLEDNEEPYQTLPFTLEVASKEIVTLEFQVQ